MGDAAGDERRQPQCGKGGLFPSVETAGEAVGGDEGDGGRQHHHVAVEAIGRGENSGEAKRRRLEWIGRIAAPQPNERDAKTTVTAP